MSALRALRTDRAAVKRAYRISKRRRLAQTWSRRPIQHPLVTLAERAPPIDGRPRTSIEARRWARNRRKHARGLS